MLCLKNTGEDPTSMTSHSPPSFEPPWQFRRRCLSKRWFQEAAKQMYIFHFFHACIIMYCIYIQSYTSHTSYILHSCWFTSSYIESQRMWQTLLTQDSNGETWAIRLGFMCLFSLCHLWTVFLEEASRHFGAPVNRSQSDDKRLLHRQNDTECRKSGQDPMNKLSDWRLGGVLLSCCNFFVWHWSYIDSLAALAPASLALELLFLLP